MSQKRTAVVTGSGGGIGGAIAAHLRREGYRVVGIDIKPSPDADVSVEADLTRWDAHAPSVEAALGDAPIDALINCAGVQIRRGPVEEVALSDIDRLYTHNLRPIFEVTQWALSRMREGGSIVNIGSISGAASVPGLAGYGAVKAAVHSFSLSLARELAPRGIRVNVVAPGYVRTPLTESMMADEKRYAEIVSRIPLGAVADGDEIASVVTALCTEPFRYVTGVVLPVDGGYLA